MRLFLFRLLAWSFAWPITRWIRRHERRILEEGEPLSASETALARQVGVSAVENIRVLAVARIPMPGTAWLHGIAQRLGYPANRAAGMSLRHGIYLNEHFQGQERTLILTHECVHTAQYERLGIRKFLADYIEQCLRDGYLEAPLEAEAIELSQRALGLDTGR